MDTNRETNWAHIVTLIVLAIILFFVYSFLSFNVWFPQYQKLGHFIYSWPDATANQAFINQLITNNSLSVPFADNTLINNIVHPRSVNVVDGQLVPMSFLGMILIFGYLGKLVTVGGTIFLTPFFAAITIFPFYFLMRKIISDRGALLTTFLLATSAPFWYYAGHVMLHQILFISLLLIGLAFLTATNLRDYSRTFVGMFFVGLALTVRTIEAIWVLPIIIALFFLYCRKKWYLFLLIGIFALSLPFIQVLIANNATYGDYFSTGYLQFNSSANLLERLPTEFQVESSGSKIVSLIKTAIIPFGLHERNILLTVQKYLLEFYWPYLILALIGFVTFIFSKNKSRSLIIYTIISLLTIAWLIFYYGNWQLADSDVLKYNFINSSYVRYWLPIYILILPAIGYLFDRISNWNKKILFWIIVPCSMILLFVYSFNLVYFSQNGLIKEKNDLNKYYFQYFQTANLMEDNAIIITDRTDKLFFSKYQVVVFRNDYSIFPELRKIIDKYPIYYLSEMDDTVNQKMNSEKLKPLALQFINPVTIDGEYRLFTLSKTHAQ